MLGNSYATQARIVPGTGPGNPLPSRPATGGRGKEALWYRDDETLQDLAELPAAARSGKPLARCLASAPAGNSLAACEGARCRRQPRGAYCCGLLQPPRPTRSSRGASYESAGAGVGTTTERRRLRSSRRASCRRATRDSRATAGDPPRTGRDARGSPESRAGGGNSPELGLYIHCRGARLESSRSDLEPMHAADAAAKAPASAPARGGKRETGGSLLHGLDCRADMDCVGK